jgi:hypothetical protein
VFQLGSDSACFSCAGEEIAGIQKMAEETYLVAQEHAAEFRLPFGSAYIGAEKLKKALQGV